MNFLPDEYAHLVLTSKVLLLKYLDIYAATICPKKGVVNLVFTPDDILYLAVSRLLFRQRFEAEVEDCPNSFYNAYLQHLRNSLDPKKNIPLNDILSFGNIIPTKTIARLNHLHEKISKADDQSKLRVNVLILFRSTAQEVTLYVETVTLAILCFNVCTAMVPHVLFIHILRIIFFSILSLTFLIKMFYPLYSHIMVIRKSKMLQKKLQKFKF
jgi:hypothetical protein